MSKEDVTAQLRDELEQSRSELTRFIGARLSRVDLSEAIINKETNAPVDLRHVEITGDVTAVGATVKQPVRLDESTIGGTVDWSNSTFTHAIQCDRLTVGEGFVAENTTFGDSVRFQEATLHGELSFRYATFEREADWYGVTVTDEMSFRQTTWRRGCQFQRSTFEGYVDFFFSSFHQQVNFQGAAFGETTRFSKSVFDEEAVFLGAEFEEEALFKKGTFGSHAYFQTVRFGNETSFSETTFREKAKFQFTTFDGEASISYARFEGNAYFQRVIFNNYAEFFECEFSEIADFRWTEFHDIGRFMDAVFRAEAYFGHAQFLGIADFRDARFEYSALFRETAFQQAPLFRRTEIETAELVNLTPGEKELTLDCEGAQIHEGRIEQREDNKVYYNFREATLGDIDLIFETTTPFERLLISRTAFDDFDFSRYHYALAPEWDLHTFSGQREFDYHTEASRFALGEREGTEDAAEQATQESGLESQTGGENRTAGKQQTLRQKLQRVTTYPRRKGNRLRESIQHAPTLETTYLKAKNGANTVGDSRAASAFFVQEMRYRRNAHIRRALTRSERLATRVRSLGVAALNWLLAISCGYGEKPYRTLSFSLLIVLFYAGVYLVVLDSSPTDSPFGYLLFSFQSFNAIILGVETEPFSEIPSFIAASQGFVGAFMIGLFVFTLTRSIHR